MSGHQPGSAVEVMMTKWGDAPHWRFSGTWLGSDEHGDWLGFPQGTLNSRPGFEFHSEVDSVTLVPRDGWHLATFHAPGIWCDLYVDITSPAVWQANALTAVDLDLDVIRMSPATPAWSALAPTNLRAGPGEVFVDDEDEFDEHRITLGYPDEVVTAARQSCADVLSAVQAVRAPYDGSHLPWLERLRTG
jgi:uncharacterized protein